MGRRPLHDSRFWKAHVNRQLRSGLSVIEYCDREGLLPHQFYNGRRRVAKDESLSDSQKPLRRGAGTTDNSRFKAAMADAAVAQHDIDAAVGSRSLSANDICEPMVVIQLNGEATVQVPAHLHSTIEMVLKMALRASTPEPQHGNGFRSIVVRS